MWQCRFVGILKRITPPSIERGRAAFRFVAVTVRIQIAWLRRLVRAIQRTTPEGIQEWSKAILYLIAVTVAVITLYLYISELVQGNPVEVPVLQNITLSAALCLPASCVTYARAIFQYG